MARIDVERHRTLVTGQLRSRFRRPMPCSALMLPRNRPTTSCTAAWIVRFLATERGPIASRGLAHVEVQVAVADVAVGDHAARRDDRENGSGRVLP